MQPPRDAPPPSLREALTALTALRRAAWFVVGALVAGTVTWVAMHRRAHADAALPYEIFPFSDNSGVCQEYVALASSLHTSHDDAREIVRTMLPSLPADIRPENVRVVRAFAPGDQWTVAVDTQFGSGDVAHAQATADALDAMAGTHPRFEAVFYGARRLYDTARVLCMPRTSGQTTTTTDAH